MGQVLPPHLMEERLIRQQQEMEEDQRWLEKEERFLVTTLQSTRPHPDPPHALLQSSIPKARGFPYIWSEALAEMGSLLFLMIF
jgi:hypothetical protein